MPDTAPKTIRQPERLECGNDVQIHETVIRARGVAKGPPSVTSVNQRWRPGQARQGAGERQAYAHAPRIVRKWKS